MMRQFRPVLFVLVAAATFIMATVFQARAVGPKVSEPLNSHNLSASNAIPGFLYKATNDPVNNPRGQQICIFCHTPHSANVAGQTPLWNRAFSSETFQRYTSLTLKIRGIATTQYTDGAQPNGSSKLCLSCHDGVSRLGAVYSGPEITMVKANPVIEGLASFRPDTNKMKSGHHPVSFVYTDAIATAINTAKGVGATTYKLPTLAEVKLDKQNRMQCTTCHDAHQNKSFEDQCYFGTENCASPNTRKKAPFWVYGAGASAAADQQAVCTTCHPMDATAGFTFTAPW